MFHSFTRNVMVAGAVCLAACLLTPQRAAGWGAGGHRVVANIAYDQLDAKTRASIVAVLRKHPDFDKRFAKPLESEKLNEEDQDRWIFLQAAIWPDLIRNVPEFHRGSWHFMNLPFFLTSVDKKALAKSIKPNVSFDLPDPLPADLGHLNCAQSYKLCLRQLTDADTTDEEKAISYCWLLHLVGDMHQPLHSTGLITRGRFNTSEGDRGGNQIRIKQSSNLHSFWDGLLGGKQPLNDIRKRSAAILSSDELKQAGADAANDLDVEDWIQESNKLAKGFVYSKDIKQAVSDGELDDNQPLRKVDLSIAYRQGAGERAQRRVAEAGFRLAAVLKELTE